MSKIPPFHANRQDNMSCFLATLRSTLEYFSGREYSWQELEALTGFNGGIAAWTVQAWTELAKQGYTIRMFENFDYKAFSKEGKAYLERHLRPEELQWQLTRSNIMEIKPLLPEFLKTVDHRQATPSLKDIDKMLDEGFLVIIGIDSGVLAGVDIYSAHVVLIYDKQDSSYIAHDPGLPAKPSSRIPEKLLWRAMGGENNNAEATGIKLVTA